MADKPAPYSFNFYHIGNSPSQQTRSKPRMLIISAVPDDNKITINRVARGGIDFTTTGNTGLPVLGEFEHEEIILGGKKSETPKFAMPDFAFNSICEPDRNKKGLELAQQIITDNKIPVLNHPENILATKRDLIYQRFVNHDGVVIPKTLRIAPKYCRDVRAIIEKGEISLPCIFRPAGTHVSHGVCLIKELSDTDELECFAFDGRDYYLSEFYDCRDGDGLYRKFRVIYVDGKIYPRHLFVSNDWCVGGKTKRTEQEYLDEEKRFVDNFQSYLGEEAIAKLNSFCATIGLDFFGLDLNMRPDRTLVLFEANACMSVFNNSQREYLEPHVNNIRMAFKEMLFRFHQTVTSRI